MRHTTDSELLHKYAPFIGKTVRNLRLASDIEWDDMFQVASLAFWQGWKRIGSPSVLSPQNLSYLKTAIAYSLHDEVSRQDGTGKNRKVRSDDECQCTVIPFGLLGQTSDITNHGDKLHPFVNLDACNPYFVCTLRDWLDSIKDREEKTIANMLISGYSVNEIKNAENICRDTIWRKRKSLRQSFADYVDLPGAAMGA